MRRLLWKEWHEQSWKLGFGCIVLGALAAIGLRSRITADETTVMWVCFLGVTLLPVLSSTGLVPAERGEGTLESLLALPVAPRKILAAKTAMGLLLCAGPMLTAMVVSLWIAGGREIADGYMAAWYVRSMLAALVLFVWMLALTIYLPNETRAALVAVGILICWMIATGGLGELRDEPWAMAASPLGFVYQVRVLDMGSLVITAVIQVAIAAGLWIWASRGLAAETEGGS